MRPYGPAQVVNSPQSTTEMRTLLANGGLSLIESRLRLNSPPTVPVFLMSTMPVCSSPPGIMFLAEKIAVPSLLLSMLSAPAVNVLPGFAVSAVKSAPEPTATPSAASPSARAPSVRLGRLPRGGSPAAAPDAPAPRAVPVPPAAPAAEAVPEPPPVPAAGAAPAPPPAGAAGAAPAPPLAPPGISPAPHLKLPLIPCLPIVSFCPAGKVKSLDQ
jgi:hypothetical protein